MTWIAVTPEGRPDVWIPDRASLKEWIVAKNFESIHNFKTSVPGMALGANHEVASVLSDIDAAERLALLTGEARLGNMNHALALIMPGERLELFDIGDVEDELMIDDGDEPELPEDVVPDVLIRLIRSVNRYERLLNAGSPQLIMDHERDMLVRRAADARDYCDDLLKLHGGGSPE